MIVFNLSYPRLYLLHVPHDNGRCFSDLGYLGEAFGKRVFVRQNSLLNLGDLAAELV